MVPSGFPIYAGLTLNAGDGSFLRLVLYRNAREGAFTEDDVRTLNRIVGNVRFATLFARRNAELLVQRRAASCLNREEPTFALDRRGRAMAMNGPADRLATGSPIAIRRGRLVAATEGKTRRVDRIVDEAVGDGRHPGSVVFHSASGERHQLLLMPLYGAAFDAFTSRRAIAVLVRIDDGRPVEHVGEAAQLLRSAFDLTEREASVAMLGAEGLAPRVIAARFGIGEGTARNHMKSAFCKIGIHSQAGLAALVARYV